jgi:hypothetical protein
LAEPVGAALGYWLLSGSLSHATFGWVFGLIAGVMVFLALDELLPAAKRYAKGHETVYGLVAGMGTLAISWCCSSGEGFPANGLRVQPCSTGFPRGPTEAQSSVTRRYGRSLLQPVQRLDQLICQRRVQYVWALAVIQRELQRGRMQEQALQPDLLTKPLVDRWIAVFVVTGHRMPQMLGVHADLVGAAGLDADFAVEWPPRRSSTRKWLIDSCRSH